MDELARLFPEWQHIMWGFGIVFLRVGAIVSFIPIFGEQSIPARVRLGIAFAFSAVIYPTVVGFVPALPSDFLGSALADVAASHPDGDGRRLCGV